MIMDNEGQEIGRYQDILDDIKDRLPVELAEARKIVNTRNEYVAAARREAEEICKRAKIEAEQMVSETLCEQNWAAKAAILLRL